jgi:uncharacterized protein (TIGR02001 family)
MKARLLVLSTLLFPLAAQAELSTTLTLTSDYTFDGISQTQEDPAAQASLDYAHDSGFYAGIWGSNVDFGPGDPADIEIDFYGGYYGDIGDTGFGYEAGLYYYTYTGAPSDGYDYGELLLAAYLPTGTIWQFWFADDDDVFDGFAWRTKLLHELALPNDFGLALQFTYVDWSDLDFDYFHWRAGITRSFAGFDFEVAYEDTDIDDDPNADSRILFTASRNFKLLD